MQPVDGVGAITVDEYGCSYGRISYESTILNEMFYFLLVGGSCCWGEAYDPATSSCCDYVVDNSLPEVPGVQSCCGSRSYLTSEEICCSGQLFSRGEHTECCGNGTRASYFLLCSYFSVMYVDFCHPLITNIDMML